MATTEGALRVDPVQDVARSRDILCITQDPTEPAPAESLAVCAKTADRFARSRYCPDNCGGHPICQPCYDLSIERGLYASD